MNFNKIVYSVCGRYFLPRSIQKSHFCVSSQKTRANLAEKYSHVEQERILNILNNVSTSTSFKLEIGEKQFKTIASYLNENKRFNNLEDLLNLNGIGPKLLLKLCDKILNGPSVASKRNSQILPKLKSSLVMPTITEQEKEQIKSVVGLQVSNFYISWSRFDRESKTITHWELVDFINSVDSKNLITIYEFVSNLRERIPSSDIYVFENVNWSVMSAQSSLLHHVKVAQTTAMLLALLNSEDSDSRSHPDTGELSGYSRKKVHFLKTYLPTRYFKTLIGSERVSPQKMVEEMFEGNFPDYCSPFNFVNNCKDYYLTSDKPVRENLCQSLLLTATFLEVVLLNKVESLRQSK